MAFTLEDLDFAEGRVGMSEMKSVFVSSRLGL